MASAGPYASLHLALERQRRQHPTTRFFYRLDALPAAQPKASKHWRYPRYLLIKWFLKNQLQLELEDPSNAEQLQYQQHAILTPAQDTDGREKGETGRWRIEEWGGEGRKGRGEKGEGKMRNRRQKGKAERRKGKKVKGKGRKLQPAWTVIGN